MQWQFLGKQELHEGRGGKGHVYLTSMWRSHVPGGWLLMTVNARSSDPNPIVSFYPDPDHVWTGETPHGADHLLRPAGGSGNLESQTLLRITGDDSPTDG
jgi:hypothetical protein